eukprot:4408113-Alexandrium_andersonii.AAC.1
MRRGVSMLSALPSAGARLPSPRQSGLLPLTGLTLQPRMSRKPLTRSSGRSRSMTVKSLNQIE